MRVFAFGMICLAFAGVGHAQTLREAVLQKGDIIVIGNTLAQDCAAGVSAPTSGNIGACGTNTADSAPDVFWRSNSPFSNFATADTGVTSAQARSQAVLALPPGALVSRAFLYWTGKSATPDTQVSIGRPGAFTAAYNADDIWTVSLGESQYTAVADVTGDVAFFGPGAWEVGGVDSIVLTNVDDSTVATAWWLVVFYSDSAAPRRSLALYDKFTSVVVDGAPATVVHPLVENTVGGTVSADIVVLDGDDATTGDALIANGSLVGDALNPSGNVFNSTHSRYGTAVSNVGDLPQLDGMARSMSGLDLDRFDVTAAAPPSTPSLTLQLTTTDDTYIPGIVAISAPAAELSDTLFSDSFEG